MTDERGVLGNLPRSRPGQRSDKRAGGGEEPSPEASPGATAREPAASSEPAGSTDPAGASAPASAPEPAGSSTSDRNGDPVSEAIRAVTGIASAGARVANGVAREVLRRLPRP